MSQQQRLEGLEEIRQAAIGLIGLARRELWIASPQLEPGLFMDAALLQALKQQLLAERRLTVQLLVSDARMARQHADRLLELVRRLPSQFLIHQPARPENAFEHELWLADHAGHLKRESPRALYASLVQKQAAATHRLRESFAEGWYQSVPSPEFRQLS